MGFNSGFKGLTARPLVARGIRGVENDVGVWTMHNEDPHDLYTSPNTVC